MKLLKRFFLSVFLLTICIVAVGYQYLYVLPKGPERTEEKPIPAGKDSFVIDAYRHTDRKTIRVWTYKPEQWVESDQVLFVMHGMGRNAEDYLDAWVDIAEKQNLMLIAPEFASKFYRVITNDYQEGNLRSYFGWTNPEEEWAFTVIENIFDHVNTVNELSLSSYDIFGHSAGGQFVQRMVLLKPESRIKHAIAANAGSYTFLVQDAPYPYGLETVTPYLDLERSLNKRLTVLLGELDNTATQGRLDQTEYAMKQGMHRLERGKNFFATARERADARDIEFSWHLRVVPGVGHNYRKMSDAAASLL